MILYQLRCRDGHEFDSWFRNSETYERQEKRGLLACPVCGSAKVEKAIMAPRIGKTSGPGRSAPAEAPAAAPVATPAPSVPQPPQGEMPAAMYAMLSELRRQVEKNCDYVGPDFAEEARKIHNGETDRRNIYGETSESEADALRDEGIEFGRIPWLPRTN